MGQNNTTPSSHSEQERQPEYYLRCRLCGSQHHIRTGQCPEDAHQCATCKSTEIVFKAIKGDKPASEEDVRAWLD